MMTRDIMMLPATKLYAATVASHSSTISNAIGQDKMQGLEE